jgi:hypothetical protein
MTAAYSLSDLKKALPGASLSRPGEGVSDSYVLVSTLDVAEALMDRGWVCGSFRTTATRDPEKAAAAPHLLRFHRLGLPTVFEGRSEVVVVNSHDGQGALTLRPGFYRTRTKASIVAGDVPVRLTHTGRGDVLDAVGELVDEVLDDVQGAEDIRSRLVLSCPDAATRAAYAGRLMSALWPSSPPDHWERGAPALLSPRTRQDIRDDAWTLMWVALENVFRGGITMAPSSPPSRRVVVTRKVRGLARTVKIGGLVWDTTVALFGGEK